MLFRGSIVVACAVAIGCGESRSPPRSGAQPGSSLEVQTVVIMPLAGPRSDNVLVPGEPLRVIARVSGGTPPYSLALRPPLAGEVSANAESDRAEIALETVLPVSATTGVTRLVVSIADATGATATGQADAAIAQIERHIDPRVPLAPYVRVVDEAGRERTGGYRGEPLKIAVDVGGEPHLPGIVRVRNPAGAVVATAAIATSPARVPMPVPPLAMAGAYTVEFVHDDRAVLESTWRVLGVPFPRADKLIIDDLRLWGGPTGWSPRATALRLGDRIRAVARVAGARGELTGQLTLRDRDSKPVASFPVPAITPKSTAPDARVFVEQIFEVPAVAPGSYALEFELFQDGQVASRHRQVRIE